MDLKTLQDMHKTWNIVDFITGPQGQGIIALGADGGVFALDNTGGTTGLTAALPRTGNGAFSFTTLPSGDRQATAPFAKGGIIELPNGGYRLINTNQQNYDFDNPPPPKPTDAQKTDVTNTQQATDTTPAAGAGDVSGSGALHAVLDPLGLGGLVDGPDGALAALHGTKGADPSYVTSVWLPQNQVFKDAFPEIAAAQAKAKAAGPGAGVHIPTPADIINYRTAAKHMADTGLIPPEFVTPEKVSALINGGVSLSEFQNRVINGVDKFLNADAADQQAFMAYHPAVDFSHAVGALLDPNLNEEAVNRAITQATIGGSAIRSGFGPIAGGQATALAQAGHGSTAEFARAATEQALTQANVGEDQSVTRNTQLGAMGGSATDQAAIERRRSQRGAGFQGGGGAGQTSGRGGTGLGNAQP